MRVFLGWDEREAEAYRVAEKSLRSHGEAVEVTKLDSERLAAYGLLRRPTDRRGGIYDLSSNAPASTDFHVSRFLVPHLAQEGLALFCDPDVVFMRPVSELFALADSKYALMVVKHHNGHKAGTKMDGQIQQLYARKNWSSVVLWNCDHPANRRLSLQDVNERPGRDLHRFYWLNDSEIGELPRRFNWLVGVNQKPDNVAIAHLTLGGPWLKNWKAAEFDEIWNVAAHE